MSHFLLRKLIREILDEGVGVGRNMHTTDITPNTWDSFQDFDIEYYPQDDGFYLMDVSFKGKKLGPTRRFNTQADAQHQARMIVDKCRVEFMNKS